VNMAYHTRWLNCQPTENTAEQPSDALSVCRQTQCNHQWYKQNINKCVHKQM